VIGVTVEHDGRPDRSHTRPTDDPWGRERESPPARESGRVWVERTADLLVPKRFISHREQIQYVVVGGWNTLFGYAVFALLFWLLQDSVPVSVILVCSYALGIANNYITYKTVVFRTRATGPGEFPRFAIVYVAILAVNLVVLPAALRYLPFNAYVIQALFAIVVVIASYLANKRFSFRSGAAGPSHEGR